MKEFVEFIVKQMVDKPDKVKIEKIDNENTVEINVRVDKSDIGKVVGKHGKNVDALRTLLTAVGAKEHHRTVLHVIE
jgi:predicted RNA-binding protein YlqC (UPF0109 family)